MSTLLNPEEIRRAVRFEGGLSRRLFLSHAAALASIPVLGQIAAPALSARPKFSHDPFSLGVASGDPDSTSVVLWTRLAPRPLEPDGGMLPDPIELSWELAGDESMSRVVKSGKLRVNSLLNHSAHILVDGLQPDRWYWYRFRAGDATSPIGRTRTLPSPESSPDRLRFAFASCQHFEAGLFTAYERMAQDDLDLVFHLGDYIYEAAARETGVRRHLAPRLLTVDDYRIRHSQYRSDPLLHNMHARCPWFVTWDDHETENNYATDISQFEGVSPAEFLIQRTAAYQVYYEMMPLRPRSIPRGPDMLLYRKASFGKLAEFFVLDTRQYRTDQPNHDQASNLNEAALDPKNTLLGPTQRTWLQDGLRSSQGQWNVLAQQVMMAMADITPGPDTKYSMDQWPGAATERMDLVRFLSRRRIKNPIVLTGDIHSNWVNDLRVDDRKPETPIVATEFVGTSISSGGNGLDKPAKLSDLLSENPGVKFHNQQRGYVRCSVTRSAWTSDYIVMDQVTKPGGKAEVRCSWTVESGKPGATPA